MALANNGQGRPREGETDTGHVVASFLDRMTYLLVGLGFSPKETGRWTIDQFYAYDRSRRERIDRRNASLTASAQRAKADGKELAVRYTVHLNEADF